MSDTRGQPELPGDHVLDWGGLAPDVPDGLAVVDSAGRFARLNAAGAGLFSRSEHELIGTPAPFPLLPHPTPDRLGLFEDGPDEQAVIWTREDGGYREFAFRARPVSGRSGLTIVAFRDVTDERHRQRRVAAIARSSVKLASAGSLVATLDALAREVLRTDALAGVQIMAADDGDGLRIMGSAGFPHWPDFFQRLIQCRDRGAKLHMLDAYERGEPVVVANRWRDLQHDPAWKPLHDYLSELQWDSFASVPLMTRGRAQGVLNAFFAPGQLVGRRSLEFLLAMAEQAAIAVDYAALLQHERAGARRAERQRLARDLHDSIVQQVFSISMQAKSMDVLGERGGPVPAEAVRRIANEVGVLSRTVLADLRAMVHELRPSSSAQLGLEEAVRALAESTRNRTGLRFSVIAGEGLEQVVGDGLTEDLYRIVAEAIHNVVKHANAGKVIIRMSVRGHRLRASIADDGRGIGRDPSGQDDGYGLTSMRERAERWGGTVRIKPRSPAGSIVQVTVPLPLRTPAVSGTPLWRRANDHSEAGT